MKKIILMGILVSTSVACAGTYTSIRQVDANTYYITRTKQGFMSVSGTLYRCTKTSDELLNCTEVDSP